MTLFLLVVLSIVSVFSQCGSEPSELQDLFSSEDCEIACWIGIEPLVTSRQEAIAILANQGIDYEVGMFASPGDSVILDTGQYQSKIDIDGDMIVFIEFFEGVVWRIWFHRADICANGVIDAYGLPDAVVATRTSSGFGVDVYYFGEGLAFFGTSETAPYFDSAFVSHEEFLRRYMGEAKTVDWDVVKDYFAAECSEAA